MFLMEVSNTKEKIVELGRSYIMHLGYHSFNYKMIATNLNMKNAAVHHYFPAKEDLGLAVIEKDRADFQERISSISDVSADVKLKAILDVYSGYFQKDKNLCMSGTFGSAYTDIPERLKQAVGQNLAIVSIWLNEVFEEGHRSGRLVFEGSPAAMSNLWITALTGSLVVGRIKGDQYFQELQQTLKTTVGI